MRTTLLVFTLIALSAPAQAAPKTGAPYTADITTDVAQQLADGNRIEHHTTSSVARDSEGRMRREQQLTAIGAILPNVDGRIVTIMDPVSKVHYSLDPARKVAMRSALPAAPPDGVLKTRIAAMSGGRVTTATAETVVINKGAASNNVRTESLGTSTIEGVEAQGTRTVVTIPAGAIGNQAAIEMITEQWFSPELGAVILSRRIDPRFGDTTYRLQNIVRAEPAPELFQVPSDYTVETMPAFGGAMFSAK